MSQILLLKTYTQSIKFQTVMDRVSDTAYQGWVQLYGLLFWLISVSMNHWRLKKEETINIDYSSLFDSSNQSLDNAITEESLPQKNKKRRKSTSTISSSGDILPPKPKFPPPTTTSNKNNSNRSNDADKKLPPHQLEKKCTKQSLSIKSHVLSWKQKLSNSQPSSPTASIPTKSLSSSLPNKVSPSITKRSFLRRLSSANSSVYSDNGSINNSSNKLELSSPTTGSILKTISLKRKKQDSGVNYKMMTEDKSSSLVVEYSASSRSRRLSLTNFRRRTFPDITLK